MSVKLQLCLAIAEARVAELEARIAELEIALSAITSLSSTQIVRLGRDIALAALKGESDE